MKFYCLGEFSFFIRDLKCETYGVALKGFSNGAQLNGDDYVSILPLARNGSGGDGQSETHRLIFPRFLSH